MSILDAIILLGIIVGVSSMFRNHDNETGRPIDLSEAQRICASLCIAGLGGKPCGETCSNIQPKNFTAQSSASGTTGRGGGGVRGLASANPRRQACPLLCQYQLGNPLCDCPDFPVDIDSYRVDFNRICAFFCIAHEYHIYGCRDCSTYRRPPYLTMDDLDRRIRPTLPDDCIDWDQWCRERCAENDGGLACDCSVPLPMSLAILPSVNVTEHKYSKENPKHEPIKG